MAGNVPFLEGAIQTITSTGAAATSGSAILAGTLNTSSGGPSATAGKVSALFSLLAQWATVTGIAANTTIADLYLVPAIDGTNFPDVDTTAGASVIPFSYRVGSFVASKVPTANTNMLFGTASAAPVELFPAIYNVYIVNRSGQPMSANWTLKAQAAGVQYT